VAAALLEARPGSLLPWFLGAVLVAALGVILVPALTEIPPRARVPVVLSGAVYVAGALGVEVFGQRYARDHGWWTAQYIAFSTVEELMEMGGVIAFVHAITPPLERRQ
jgi:hypothetical protein